MREAYLAARSAAQPSRSEPLWLPAGLLAVLATLLTALSAAGGEVYDSGWSSTTDTARFQRTTTQHVVQAVRPASGNVSKLRLVAFEEESQPGRGSFGQRGSASLQSVVVEKNGQRRSYRVAQEDDLLDSFSQPFGEEPVTPMEEPGDDVPSFGDPDLAPLPPLENGSDDITPEPPKPDPFEKPETASPSNEPGMELEDVRPEDIGSPRTKRDDDRKGFSEAMKNCAEELAELKASRIAEIDLSVRLEGSAGEDYPYECGIDDGTPFAQRSWPQVCYMWKASALCHKPLYFENVQLERYGHSWGPFVQPFVSGAHFFTRLPMLPYCMGLKAPNECVYTLGHYRPGSCAPYLIEPIPMTWRAAAFQGAAVTGGIFLFP